MANVSKQLDELIAEPLKPGETEAHLLQSRLKDLARASLGIGREQAHSVLLDFFKQATAALELHQGKLEKSPSASTLLDYLMHAMSKYVDTIDRLPEVNQTATSRRQALANAFMLTGERLAGISEHLRIDVCHAFSRSIEEQTAQTCALPTPKQLTAARRAAYRVYWGEEWVADDDTAKSRMKSVTGLLQAEGYDPGKVTLD